MKLLPLCCAGLLLGLALPVAAQATRDPTRPPLSSGAGAAVSAPAASAPWSLLYVDGKPHVVAGTRLYAEGQMLGAARIERITETEVWLREGGRLRKVAHYPSVRRRSVP